MTAPTKEQALRCLEVLGSHLASENLQDAAQYVRSFIESTSDAELPVGEPVAWMTEDGRTISEKQKAALIRDGGASASSMRAYSIPLYAGRGSGVNE
jgi:hypothetical protein